MTGAPGTDVSYSHSGARLCTALKVDTRTLYQIRRVLQSDQVHESCGSRVMCLGYFDITQERRLHSSSKHGNGVSTPPSLKVVYSPCINHYHETNLFNYCQITWFVDQLI
jgi:hypothetical protein